AQRLPQRYDLSRPTNQRKLEATEALAQLAEEAGMSLIHLAIAFVLNHPAVTSAIIGPRTMEQLESQLGAADVTLDRVLLDRIDEIVPPGTNFSYDDAGFVPPAVADPSRRRRAWPPPGVGEMRERMLRGELDVADEPDLATDFARAQE